MGIKFWKKRLVYLPDTKLCIYHHTIIYDLILLNTCPHRWFYLDETKLQYFLSETSPNSSTRTPIYTISMVFFYACICKYTGIQHLCVSSYCPHTTIYVSSLFMCLLTDLFFF
jgi:hypothetical protein